MATTQPISHHFVIKPSLRSYKHQYSNIYFIRLGQLRRAVEERAHALWHDVSGSPILVPRVLDVVKSQLCYVVGTVYMDMPQKPNVLEDLGRDQSIPAPPHKDKFYSDDDGVMLEDESGRIRLVGQPVLTANLVTGVILGALGAETANGDFEVVDICYAGMAPYAHISHLEETPAGEWVALVSGLNIGSESSSDGQVQLFIEYLSSELGGEHRTSNSPQITRLIIAGNSLAPLDAPGEAETIEEEVDKKQLRYGQDVTTFSPQPIHNLSDCLSDVAQSIPIHILPGPADPSGVILPQQPFPRAMFGPASSTEAFHCETNPTYLDVPYGSTTLEPSPFTRQLLISSGQPLNDMFKYVATPPATHTLLAEATLLWRHMAPTAPDTLWCHPYFTDDPFVINHTPDIYIIGNQPDLSTKMVDNGSGRPCRIILLPEFSATGVVALVNLCDLDVRVIRCNVG